jgi:hypothetical protein
MSTPKAQPHANNIRYVHSFVKEQPEFDEYYTSELGEWSDNFALKAERGWYEEIPGVPMRDYFYYVV